MVIGQVPPKQYRKTATKALAASSALTRRYHPSLVAFFGKESDKEISGDYLKHTNVKAVTNCQQMRDLCSGRQCITFPGPAFL